MFDWGGSPSRGPAPWLVDAAGGVTRAGGPAPWWCFEGRAAADVRADGAVMGARSVPLWLTLGKSTHLLSRTTRFDPLPGRNGRGLFVFCCVFYPLFLGGIGGRVKMRKKKALTVGKWCWRGSSWTTRRLNSLFRGILCDFSGFWERLIRECPRHPGAASRGGAPGPGGPGYHLTWGPPFNQSPNP